MKILENAWARKVRFKKAFFEDDFVERGMIAWLTDVQWDEIGYYKLYFDFKDFEEQNEKYFKRSYYPNIHTARLTKEQLEGRCGDHGSRDLFTAREAGMYRSKDHFLFTPQGLVDDQRDDTKFDDQIKDYLEFLS